MTGIPCKRTHPFRLRSKGLLSKCTGTARRLLRASLKLGEVSQAANLKLKG